MTEASGKANHLIDALSPYLLQHAYNPVDWYPWGEEALEKALTEDKPIFLSIGYAACHWCHVMEHESFENAKIAAALNEHFVSIKVDREERPDLDEIYMAAVTSMTGSGGWPMSVFLTPELKPFYGGTYYPPEDILGRPGFYRVVMSLAQAWTERRKEIYEGAEELTQVIQARTSPRSTEGGPLDAALLTKAAAQLRQAFDAKYGGWGDAPKFPSSGSVNVLLRIHHREQDGQLLEMARFTLNKMAQGGLYDHLGGGFHRYSVDSMWLVPHFEKMLYDNAQLAQAYTEAYQVTGDPLYRCVATGTLDYVLRDMHDAGGAFHASEDADSEGEEGKFYVWTEAELVKVLGKDAGDLFCRYYNVRKSGNFSSYEPYHRGMNILHVTETEEAFATRVGVSPDELESILAAGRSKLLELRGQRARPGKDDKIIASWNGLIITALSQGAQVFGDSRYTEAAANAADFLLTHMIHEGVLMRIHRRGKSSVEGYLDDYAFVANALVDLYETTFNVRWLDAVEALATQMVARFQDEDGGLFCYTAPSHQHLIARTKPGFDGAEPSGNSIAALALLRLGKLLDQQALTEQGNRILEASAAAMAQYPTAYLKMLCAVDLQVYPGREIAIAGAPEDTATRALIRVAHEAFVPGRTLALHPLDAAIEEKIPLLRGKTLVEGAPAAYVCRDFSCEAPVTTPGALRAALGGRLEVKSSPQP